MNKQTMIGKIFCRAISHISMALVVVLTVSFLGLFANTLNAQDTFYLSGSVYHQKVVPGPSDATIPVGGAQLWPFLKVTAFEKTSDTTLLLGTSDTHPSTGGYNMLFTRPDTTPIPEVIIVVSEIVEGDEEILHQETLTNVGQFTYTNIVIEDTDPMLTGLPGVVPGLGLGVFFTRVGNVDRDSIVQTVDPVNPKLGVADLTPEQAIYTEQFRDAAFGGNLQIFGQFAEIIEGSPDTIDYYQVQLQRVDEDGTTLIGGPIILMDPLTNVRKRFDFFAGTYESEWIELGPLPSMQNDVTLANEEGLYKVVKPVASGGIYEYWTWPDLLAYWKSSKYPDGIYILTLHLFHEISATQVHKLIPVTNPADDIIIRIENRPPTAEFVNIIKTNGGDVVVADFTAGTGLCDIIELDPGEQLKVTFKAHQPGGFMQSYHLFARPNQGATITFAQGSYPGSKVPAPAPGSPVWYWEGTSAAGMTSAPQTFTVQCGYVFGLTLTPRIQDGYHWIYERYPHYAFYVIPPPPSP